MARFNGALISATALSTGVNSASATVGGLFANIYLSAASSFRIRRLTFGIQSTTIPPTSQQITICAVRSSAIGAGATAQTLNQMDPNSFATNVKAGVTGWTTTPTLAGAAQANYSLIWSFNVQSGADLPWEMLEELYTSGSGNGFAFFNLNNALPSGTAITLAYEIEE
jgi:hypothetical protein